MPKYTDEDFERLITATNPYAEHRPKLTDEDFDRMLSGIPRFRDENGPGVVKSYLRGLALEGPSQIAGAVGSLGDAAAWLQVPGQETDYGKKFEDTARANLMNLVDIDEPVTDPEKTAQAAGVGTAFGVAAAPLAATSGPAVIGGEILAATVGGGTGEELRQSAEEHGAGGIGQSAASIAGDLAMSAAAPGLIISKGPKIVQNAKNIKHAMNVGPEIERIAKSLGVPVRALVRDAGEFKTFVPRHASGDERYIQEWSDALGRATERFAPDEMPTTRQIIEAETGDSGSALTSLEEGLGRGSRGFGADVAGRRKAAVDSLRERYGELLPDEGPDVAITAYEQVKRSRANAVDDLWSRVPQEEIPMVPTEKLKKGAQEAIDRAGEFSQDVPEEALKVLDWPDEVSWDQFQKMRSRALRSDRLGRNSVAETSAKHKADNRSPLIEAFNEQLDSLVQESGDAGKAYKKALRATKKFHEDFNPKSVVVRSFEDMTEGARISKKILASKRPAEEAKRAVRILDQSPGGRDSLRRMLFDEIIGSGELNPGRAKSALSKLKKNENAARIVLGDDSYESAIDILERAKMVNIGKTGKSAQATSVGSGASPLGAMIARSDAMIDPSSTASSLVKKMIQKALKEGVVTSRILREAALDPKLAKVLLDMPTPRSVEAWAINWKQLMARATARTSVKEKTSHGKAPRGGNR